MGLDLPYACSRAAAAALSPAGDGEAAHMPHTQHPTYSGHSGLTAHPQFISDLNQHHSVCSSGSHLLDQLGPSRLIPGGQKWSDSSDSCWCLLPVSLRPASSPALCHQANVISEMLWGHLEKDRSELDGEPEPEWLWSGYNISHPYNFSTALWQEQLFELHPVFLVFHLLKQQHSPHFS